MKLDGSDLWWLGIYVAYQLSFQNVIVSEVGLRTGVILMAAWTDFYIKKPLFWGKKKPKTDAYHVLFLFISPFFFHSFLSFSLFFFSSFSFFPLIFFSSSPPSNRLLYPRSGQVENSVRVCVWVPHQHVGYPFHGCCRATAASDHYVSPWRRVSVCFEASTQYGTFAASVFHEASRWPPLALGTIERLHDPPLL